MSGITAESVEDVRRFNRFYTSQLGLLDDGLLRSDYSLAEARVLFELAHREETTATELAADLRMDPGYLSRLLARLANGNLLSKRPAEDDGRRRLLKLTRAGREAFAVLNSRSRHQIESMLAPMSGENRRRLTAAMKTIGDVLGATAEPSKPFVLRPHQPGDIGWVTHRHGVLYSEEYGWDETFESLVARILAEFIDNFDAKLERSWIAEADGE